MIRLWTDKELSLIGKDMDITTEFMNCKSFSVEPLKYYPYHLRRTFICNWYNNGIPTEDITVHATDVMALKRYLAKEYNKMPSYVYEKIIQLKEIKL